MFMKNYIVQPPLLFSSLARYSQWRIPSDKQVYLTFDDGPTPQITERVIEILNSFKVKGTFFCVGSNVEKFPDIFHLLIKEKMGIANHTYSHMNGWKERKNKYLEDIAKAADLISSKLFRPPYGKMKISQAKALSEKYKLIMWDVLTKDYSEKTTPKECFQNVVEYTRGGSIIVFHDSKKAFKRLEYALPKSIEYLLKKGFDMSKVLS